MKSLFKNIVIPALGGKETLESSKLFAYIDSDFKNWDLNEEKETQAGNFEVFELDKNMTFREMFTQPEKQWMTQGQIIEFIKENQDKLRQDGYVTFFLLKKDTDFFVASVNVSSGGLIVFVHRFGFGLVWRAERQRRLVSPQLNSEPLNPSPLDTQSLCTLDEAIKICKANGLRIIRTTTKVIEEEL